MIEAADILRWSPVLMAPLVGSFLGTVIVRLPRGEPLLLGRSRCRHCRRRLGPADLVPFVSWLALRGRCRGCGGSIGAFYPVVELAAAAAALWAACVVEPGALWVSCALGWALLAIAWIDARHFVVPDRLSLPLAAAGLLWAAAAPGRLAEHAIGAALGLIAFAALALGYRRLRGRDGLGLGDAKLLAAGGAWVGWQGLPGIVFMGALSGLVAALASAAAGRSLTASTRLPFAPSLCLGIWLVWLYGPLLPG